MSRKPAENPPLFPEEPLAEVAYCHDGSLEGLLSAVFTGNTACAGTHLRWRQAGGIIDIDIAFFEQNTHGAGNACPVFIIELPGTDFSLVNARQRRQRTHHNLF